VTFRFAAAALAALSLASHSAPAGVPQEWSPAEFGIGEHAEYSIKYGIIGGGGATMDITGLDTIRGRTAWHVEFNIRGGVPFFRVNDRYETWIDTHNTSSLRYREDIHEGGYKRQRLYDFLSGGRMTEEAKTDTVPTAEHPIDQASVLYFIRKIPLRVGLDTSFNNYFLLDRNPVRIKVLRKEHIGVPAGEFDAIVIQPIIKAKGIFAEGGEAEVWLSDDDRHIILQMKSKVPGFPLGHLNLFLKSYSPPPPHSPSNKP
jgi:hypothetical protein